MTITTNHTRKSWYALVLIVFFMGLSKEETEKQETKKPIEIIYTYEIDENLKSKGLLTDKSKIVLDYDYAVSKLKKNGLIQGYLGYKIKSRNNRNGWTCVYISPGIDKDSLKKAIELVTN